MSDAHNIYIHVPYCMSKCNYCAFFSAACANPDWEQYTRDIIAEIDHWARMLGRVDVPTIFFGGGTPSLMPTADFARILNHINACFNIAPECEITLESNPGTLDDARLRDFIVAGVNRLSVGVQSLDDARLQFLGRRHSATDALRLLDWAMGQKLRVSADFIYGLPNDTAADVIDLCRRINSLGISHCSMYELTVEENTPFGRMNLEMPSNSMMADMYNAIDDTLRLPRYEVSNYATPGMECRHNVNVWDGAPYIGIGRGAAGRVLSGGVWHEQMGAGARFAPMDSRSRACEMVITGMRTMRGVKITPDVAKVINMDYVAHNPELVVRCGDRIVATKRGILILDELLVNLVL